MLVLLNSLDPSRLDDLQAMAGNEDVSLVLHGDAAYYASQSMLGKLHHLEFEDIYVVKDALDARGISAAGAAEAVDYEALADLILNDHDRVVSL